MSHVCDVILVTLIGWEDDPEKKEQEIAPIQDYLREHHYGCKLNRVDDHAGGDKHIQADIWMGAFNGLNVQEFVDVFRKVTWESPERVQLFLKDEHDDRFTVYEPNKHGQ